MSACGQARSASAWMVETNCEPMRPTPTGRAIVSPSFADSMTALAAPTTPARPPELRPRHRDLSGGDERGPRDRLPDRRREDS